MENPNTKKKSVCIIIIFQLGFMGAVRTFAIWMMNIAIHYLFLSLGNEGCIHCTNRADYGEPLTPYTPYFLYLIIIASTILSHISSIVHR